MSKELGPKVSGGSGAGCAPSVVALVLVAVALWLIPNNEADWVQGATHDACAAISGDDEWRCD